MVDKPLWILNSPRGFLFHRSVSKEVDEWMLKLYELLGIPWSSIEKSFVMTDSEYMCFRNHFPRWLLLKGYTMESIIKDILLFKAFYSMIHMYSTSPPENPEKTEEATETNPYEGPEWALVAYCGSKPLSRKYHGLAVSSKIDPKLIEELQFTYPMLSELKPLKPLNSLNSSNTDNALERSLQIEFQELVQVQPGISTYAFIYHKDFHTVIVVPTEADSLKPVIQWLPEFEWMEELKFHADIYESTAKPLFHLKEYDSVHSLNKKIEAFKTLYLE